MVTTKLSTRTIPTYELGKPEINPVFFEKRVYQGSSGKVYPVPFIDKVFDNPVNRSYQEAIIENDFVRLVMLPEIGGRIFEAQDKANNNYDFFYKQEVIKPALVGLAGPWISGGVEFNWPQHHRPGTYLPTDVFIEEESDGAKTVWMSEYDPMYRLKGMHGIRVRPNSALIELRGRLYNRTALTQTFLWWANVAVKVHKDYESFFPPDVHYVADHAVRAMSSFPIAENFYYGIPYHKRPGRNDLRKYENITVPTSYMVCDTKYDFFGGYDHQADGGFVHVANRHIAPGKKQWTWGSEEFGKAWDRELTDIGGPYYELMAGVYTDNQPDFTYLLPFETKTFSQFWWSYKKLGPVQNANKKAALKLELNKGNRVEMGIATSSPMKGLTALYGVGDKVEKISIAEVGPEKPWLAERTFESGDEHKLSLSVIDEKGGVLISYQHREINKSRDRRVAFEPKAPEDVESSSQLDLIGEHLELYRHPTRYPEPYWQEAINQDPKNYNAYISLSKQSLKAGSFVESKKYAEKAVDILTTYHPNPSTGEAHYYLGLSAFYLDELDIAYGAFYKATWNYEWRSSSYYILAKLDTLQGDLETAIEHLDASLVTNMQNNSAHIMKATVLGAMEKQDEAIIGLTDLLKDDPLDQWANYELGVLLGDHSKFLELSRNDAQTIIDIAFEYLEAGFFQRAADLLRLHLDEAIADCAVPNPMGKSIMPELLLARIQFQLGEELQGEAMLKKATSGSFDYFFPSRLSELKVLEWLEKTRPGYPLIQYGLGNYYFNAKRHQDAIDIWQKAADNNCDYATLYRNLGIAYWNANEEGEKARSCFKEAIKLAPDDMRIQFEYDQLRKKLNDNPGERLKDVLGLGDLVLSRDDFSVELAALYNLTGQSKVALELLTSRNFHPWEGGEGQVLKQYSYACLNLGQRALAENDASLALRFFNESFDTPDSLGEKYHPLQAVAHINYWKGMAYKALGEGDKAKEYFVLSAEEEGDFIDMAVSDFSELTYFKVLSLLELSREGEARTILEEMKVFASNKLQEKAKIDYFATSLPLLLVFEDDIQIRNTIEAYYLMGLAELATDNDSSATKYFKNVLDLNASHIGAQDYLKKISNKHIKVNN